MIAIISGPRDFADFQAFTMLADSCPWKDSIELVLSGACGLDEKSAKHMPPFAKGADGLGERWALVRDFSVQRYVAKWKVNGKYDPSAGPKRNRLMAEVAHGLIAIPNAPPYPHSGTWNMIAEAVRYGLEIWVPKEYRDDVMMLEDSAKCSPRLGAQGLLDEVMVLRGKAAPSGFAASVAR